MSFTMSGKPTRFTRRGEIVRDLIGAGIAVGVGVGFLVISTVVLFKYIGLI